jgi:serine/threonine protein kinase
LAARGINVDDAQRYTLLRETASALAFLHKHGVCVGDISPKNLLFSLQPHGALYFIDCDAMRINTVSALPQVETPGWDTPPGEELATIYSDTYKLGLLALRLLAGHQDTKNPQHLPPTTPSLLRQIITDTLTNAPAQRPLPEAWTYVLGHAIEHAQHQKLTATTVAAPVSTPLEPPPTPSCTPDQPDKPHLPNHPHRPRNSNRRSADHHQQAHRRLVSRHHPLRHHQPANRIHRSPKYGPPSAGLRWLSPRCLWSWPRWNASATTTAHHQAHRKPRTLSPLRTPLRLLRLRPRTRPTPTPEPTTTTTTTSPAAMYVVIVVSSTGHLEWANNYTSLEAATESAMSQCQEKAPNCARVAWNENGCAAFAWNGNRGCGGSGSTKDEAERVALANNHGGHIEESLCTS